MRIHLVLGIAGLALGAGLVSCSKSDAPPSGAAGVANGGNGSGGSSPSGGGGASGSAGRPSNEPAITSAPPAWVRPGDCGGIGNLCPNLSGCSTGSTCQLSGNVCIPKLEEGATLLPSKSMERPYCAAYTCMTFDEASCFCTGDAGKTEPGCLSPAALAGLCAGQGYRCGTDDPCCDGLGCVNRGTGSACEQICQTAADCESGCCTDLYDTGTLICAKAEACENPCKKRGETCTQGSETTPSDCCRGTCLQSENPDFDGCRPRCNTNADCDTGCCEPFSNGGGFCVDAAYCSCVGADAPCDGTGKATCCDGFTCAGRDGVFTCRQSCTQPSDCASGCCRMLTGSAQSICAPENECPP